MYLFVYGPISPAPVVSVMLFVCRMTVYCVPFDIGFMGVMFSVLLVMVVVNGFAFPMVVLLSSIQGLVPYLMFLLKVIFIILFIGTFTALFTGFVLVTTGGSVVVNFIPYGPTKPVPKVSVILLECIMTIYLVPVVNNMVGVMDSTLFNMLVVNDLAVPVV